MEGSERTINPYWIRRGLILSYYGLFCLTMAYSQIEQVPAPERIAGRDRRERKERKMEKGMDDHFLKQPLSMIAKIERGKFSPRPRNDPQYYGGTTPFIQTGDITRAGRTIVSWSQTLNEKGLGVSRLFPKGTILMTIAANIGDVAISSFETACPDSVVALIPENGIDHEWLLQTLKFSKPGFAALATQNAQANLSLEKIAPFQGTCPPTPRTAQDRRNPADMGQSDREIGGIVGN